MNPKTLPENKYWRKNQMNCFINCHIKDVKINKLRVKDIKNIKIS